MNRTRNQTKALCAACAANVLFGFSFMASQNAMRYTDIFTVLFSRYLVSMIISLLAMFLLKAKVDYRGKRVGRIIGMCIAEPFLYMICELYGIKLTTTSFSGIMIALVHIASMILSAIFINERPNKRQVAFSLLSLAGVIVITLTGQSSGTIQPMGVIFLWGAVITAGIYNVLSRATSMEFTPFERTFMISIVGTTGFGAMTFIMNGAEAPAMLISAFSDKSYIFSILYLALGTTSIAFFFFNYAGTFLTATKVASFANLVTVVSVLAGVFLLKESILPVQAVCCAVIMLGVWGVNIYGLKKS
ncbi:MAG: DMT family transporter, partial [Firmicutes bacterium]|nr:DMT family transporter [Bacillota bacterium]